MCVVGALGAGRAGLGGGGSRGEAVWAVKMGELGMIGAAHAGLGLLDCCKKGLGQRSAGLYITELCFSGSEIPRGGGGQCKGRRGGLGTARGETASKQGAGRLAAESGSLLHLIARTGLLSAGSVNTDRVHA